MPLDSSSAPSQKMSDFGPPLHSTALASFQPPSTISAVQKRSGYLAPLSAQTRSMSRVNTHHSLSLAAMAHDHKTVFGGARRKREPLLNSLMGAAGHKGNEENVYDGRNRVEDVAGEEERPRKVPKVSRPRLPYVKDRLEIHPVRRSSSTTSQTLTPEKRTPFFPFEMPPGTPTIYLPKPESPAGSESSEDSLMIKPTPKKVRMPVGPSDNTQQGEADKIGGTRRMLWANGVPSDSCETVQENGLHPGLNSQKKEPVNPVALSANTQPRIGGAHMSTDSRVAGFPLPSKASSIGPVRHKHGASFSISTLPRAGASYAPPTKASLASSSISTVGASGKVGVIAKHGDGKDSNNPSGLGSGSGALGLMRRPRADDSRLAKGDLRRDSLVQPKTGVRKLGPPVAVGLHERSSTISGHLSHLALPGDKGSIQQSLSTTEGQRTPQLSDMMDVDPPATAPSASSAAPASKPTGIPTLSKLPIGIRKPSAIPHASSVSGNQAPSKSSPNIRRPSYPSSLGSGPPAKPTPRVVSNPVVSKENLRQLSANAHDVLDGIVPTANGATKTTAGMRAVSDPSQCSALARSASIRNGLGNDAAKGLTGLNAAMAKLQMRKALGHGMMKSAGLATEDGGSASMPHRSSAQVDQMDVDDAGHARTIEASSGHPHSNLSKSSSGLPRPRSSLASSMAPPSSYRPPSEAQPPSTSGISIPVGTRRISGSATLRDLMSVAAGGDSLKGVTAFVDVRTSEGDDSSSVFAEMLKGCGAKVLARPSESITHIIFKSGTASTLAWWRRQDEPRPHIVGIGWVTRCKEVGSQIPEETYAVNVEDQAVFQRRRKSMEPRQLASMMAAGVPGITLTAPAGPHAALQAIAQARRQSTQFMPKISSPLKKTAGRPMRADSDDDE